MWSTSQILMVIGLMFEFLSVAVTIRKLFWGYDRRLNEHMTTQQRISKDKMEGRIIVTLLSIGIFLQALAVFVN